MIVTVFFSSSIAAVKLARVKSNVCPNRCLKNIFQIDFERNEKENRFWHERIQKSFLHLLHQSCSIFFEEFVIWIEHFFDLLFFFLCFFIVQLKLPYRHSIKRQKCNSREIDKSSLIFSSTLVVLYLVHHVFLFLIVCNVANLQWHLSVPSKSIWKSKNKQKRVKCSSYSIGESIGRFWCV